MTGEAAASGEHSLKFADAAGLTHVFDPHMFYVPHFTRGRATLSFDARLEQGAILIRNPSARLAWSEVDDNVLLFASGQFFIPVVLVGGIQGLLGLIFRRKTIPYTVAISLGTTAWLWLSARG